MSNLQWNYWHIVHVLLFGHYRTQDFGMGISPQVSEHMVRWLDVTTGNVATTHNITTVAHNLRLGPKFDVTVQKLWLGFEP